MNKLFAKKFTLDALSPLNAVLKTQFGVLLAITRLQKPFLLTILPSLRVNAPTLRTL